MGCDVGAGVAKEHRVPALDDGEPPGEGGRRLERELVGLALEAAPMEEKKKAIVPDDETIRKALETAEGNVTKAARDLGMHRTQLRRWIAKNRGGS